MPTDPSSAPATTTRRSFLLRSAAGSALATTGMLGLPLVAQVPAAGAQESTGLDDEAFASFTAPLELGAVLAYQAGLDSGRLDGTWTTDALEFQGHHQDVVETLITLLPTTASPPVAADAFSQPIAKSISDASDQDGVLTALGEMEDALSATHLLALESIDDPVTAQIVAQVLAAEAQQATSLLRGGGADVKAVTPPAADTTGALSPGDVPGAPPAADGGSDSGGSDAGSAGSDSGSGDSGSGSSGGSSSSGGNSSGGAGSSGGSADPAGGDSGGGASGAGDPAGGGSGSGPGSN
ncbi:MAG: ferritin-like domain-containing protein [Acidimicrobiales bacterium]